MTASQRVAVVTGVSPGGLGVEIAKELALEGFRLVVSDHPRKRADLQLVVDVLNADGHEVYGVPADITNEADVLHLAEEALRYSSTIDVLVNNAGTMLRKDLFSTTLEEWRTVVETNLTGTWLVCRAIGRHMCNLHAGSVVNVSSVYADRVGRLPEAAYYSSKAAVSNLTRALAAEFGSYGVTVNCIAPGAFYPTNMTIALDEATRAAMTDRTMLGRLGDPSRDIGGVVRFLSSSAATYITGQTIYVDGGWSAW